MVREQSWRPHIEALRGAELARMEHDWSLWARPAQLPPEGDWATWLILAGRGFGKTRAGAEWVRAQAEAHPSFRIALVGATAGEARSVMVEGASGLLSLGPPAMRPRWEPSLGRLRWPNGAVAEVYSAAEPDSLRGPQFNAAWADEVAKWTQPNKAWTNLQLGLRIGARPRAVATTTPRPTPFLRDLAAKAAVTRGTTWDARSTLPRAFLAEMRAQYDGTPVGRQELDGLLVEVAEDALWTPAALARCRIAAAPDLVRVVIGVDPPAGEQGDACGIVAAGLGADGNGYVLEDASVSAGSPDRWARAVADAAGRHAADRVVAEANNGGAMVRAVLHAADDRLPVTLVHAARGKAARAEPVATLYARGRVRHVGRMAELEEELSGFSATGWTGEGSPDRADALVWALSALMLERSAAPGMRLL
ncbi:DNA-packaging protein [Sphingomonas jatrophae]|nr:terminase family protein [Sphingomonas jatrophae]